MPSFLKAEGLYVLKIVSQYFFKLFLNTLFYPLFLVQMVGLVGIEPTTNWL